jgi:hypothetical protein
MSELSDRELLELAARAGAGTTRPMDFLGAFYLGAFYLTFTKPQLHRFVEIVTELVAAREREACLAITAKYRGQDGEAIADEIRARWDKKE